jgi:hypothetical protein
MVGGIIRGYAAHFLISNSGTSDASHFAEKQISPFSPNLPQESRNKTDVAFSCETGEKRPWLYDGEYPVTVFNRAGWSDTCKSAQ